MTFEIGPSTMSSRFDWLFLCGRSAKIDEIWFVFDLITNYRNPIWQQNDNDIKTASPKSINWKKYKYITKSQQESDEEKSTYDRSFPTDRSDVNAVHRSSETTPVKTGWLLHISLYFNTSILPTGGHTIIP